MLRFASGMKIGVSSFTFMVTLIVVLPKTLMAEPRDRVIQLTCGAQLQHNTTIFGPNFIANMQKISNQIPDQGWGVSSTGSGPDTAFALVQCHDDLPTLDCVLCYAEARTFLPKCYPQNGGRIFLDGCFVRSENYSFFNEYRGPSDHAVCGNRTRKDSAFQESTRRAVLQAAKEAPNSNGFAHAELPVSGATNESAFVLATCWKTLSANSCRACMENASGSILGCLPSSEGRALNTGCFIRYSDKNFLNPTARRSSSRGTIIIIVFAAISSAVVLVVVATIGFYFWNNRRIEKKRKGSNDAEKLAKILRDSSLNFKYSTLEKATGSFDEANKLGQGGFGTVYKGVLPDGREIAVKRVFLNHKLRAADFYNEINIISSLEHKNLVRLLGCSCSGPESLLVYEFLPNKSLDRFIFDPNKGKALDWEKRFNIITGTAEGLVYLHENTLVRIVHRDIKASNILLDSKLNAKIADFGLARSFEEDQSHISTAIAGTFGYMAPEYISHGKLTEKADVYSFGVLLLEIATGRQNNTNKTSEYLDNLVPTVWKHFQDGRVQDLLETNLLLFGELEANIRHEVFRVVQIGLLCTQRIPSLRPTMSTALQMLLRKDERLPLPTLPPFLNGNEPTMGLGNVDDKLRYPPKCGDLASNAGISYSTIYPR